MADIKTGDVVQLKSGGPKMTVNGLDEYGNAFCLWFADSKVDSKSFAAETLAKV
ncbi:MAG: DUF2158 domain-containing protein [Bryocella sp.]